MTSSLESEDASQAAAISTQAIIERARNSSRSKVLLKPVDLPDNMGMTEPLTRPELDAKLETIEARMDGRLARIEDRFDRIDATIADLRTSLQSTKNAVWFAAATTIAAVFAALAYGNGMFDSGRETAKLVAESHARAAQAQQETAAALSEIRQIVSDLKAGK